MENWLMDENTGSDFYKKPCLLTFENIIEKRSDDGNWNIVIVGSES